MLLEDEYQELLKQEVNEDEGAGDIADKVDAMMSATKGNRALSEFGFGRQPRGLSEYQRGKSLVDEKPFAESQFAPVSPNGAEFMIKKMDKVAPTLEVERMDSMASSNINSTPKAQDGTDNKINPSTPLLD